MERWNEKKHQMRQKRAEAAGAVRGDAVVELWRAVERDSNGVVEWWNDAALAVERWNRTIVFTPPSDILGLTEIHWRCGHP